MNYLAGQAGCAGKADPALSLILFSSKLIHGLEFYDDEIF